MTKSILYYTDCRIQGHIIWNLAQKFIGEIAKEKGLPIVCCSLRPVNFGDKRIVIEGQERSYPTMALQILTALKAAESKYVYFCEHDCLYHSSHFDFTPPTDDVYYYNVNNWRWWFPHNYLITYDGLNSLSMMCCNRELAIRHYELRLRLIEEQGLDKVRSREPRWARQFGYEPGTKLRRRGGVTDEGFVKVKSVLPNIDIRHKRTFSAPKVRLEDFKHPPDDFVTGTFDDIPYWDLRGLFNL